MVRVATHQACTVPVAASQADSTAELGAQEWLIQRVWSTMST